MAGLQDSAGDLALWLHLRGIPASDAPDGLAPPPGKGPLLLVHVAAGQDDPPALAPVLQAMRAAQPDLRLVIEGGTERDVAGRGDGGLPRGILRIPPIRDRTTAARLMTDFAPGALLILGEDLPAALIAAASEDGIPVVMAEARLDGRIRRGFWRDNLTHSLFSRLDHILAPDQPSATLARNLGGRRAAIEVTGPVTDTRPPLPGNEAERRVMAQLLRDRYIWLAAAPTLPEALVALSAHHEMLHYNHRALLIIAGLPTDTLSEIVQKSTELGMDVILRSDDDDPCADDQVLIAEDDDEMGLWFRLAPVCFMGGTLAAGDGLPPRHPFEPAALGSAIIHGPLSGPLDAEWAQLDGANAARRVADAEGLMKAVADLSNADQAAALAQNAWGVCTGGAAVVRHIAATVLGAIGGR